MFFSNNNQDTHCWDCKGHLPTQGFDRVLPVPCRRRGNICIILLCLKCRRREFEANKEPYPPGIETFTYPHFRAEIRPRITGFEAMMQYCLDASHLARLPNVSILPLRDTHEIYQIKVYEEKLVLDLARWVFGGEVGVANARQLFAEKNGHMELPPTGDVLERRNTIRQMFFEKGLFADPDLAHIKRFVECGQGNLPEIVDLYAD